MGDLLSDIQVIFPFHNRTQAALDLFQAGQLFGVFFPQGRACLEIAVRWLDHLMS